MMEVHRSIVIAIITTMCSQSKGMVYLKETEGTFSSYSDGGGISEQWIIQVPSGRIQLTFDDSFDLGTKDEHCDFTYVKVYDGNLRNEEFLRYRHCGPETPHKIISSSNTLLVEFSAGKNTGRIGFTARYSEIKESDIEYEIIRTEENWEGAFSECRENNGYLVKTSNEEDGNRLRQHIRANEEVWVGTYTKPESFTEERMNDSCHYMAVKDEKLSTYKGNCADQRPFYCRKTNIIRTTSETTSTFTGSMSYKTTGDFRKIQTDAEEEDTAGFPTMLHIVLIIAALIGGVGTFVTVCIYRKRKKKRNIHTIQQSSKDDSAT